MVIINLLFTKTRFLNEFNLIKYECGLLSYTRNTLEVGRATYRFLVNGEWSGALRSAMRPVLEVSPVLLRYHGGKDRKHLSDARI